MHVEVQNGDDWKILKIDGKVWYENHNIPMSIWCQVLQMVGVSSAILSGEFIDDDTANFVPQDTELFAIARSDPMTPPCNPPLPGGGNIW